MENRIDRRKAHLKPARRVLAVILVVFAGFALRLWELQIVKGDKYLEMSEGNRLRSEKVTAPRGILFDRYGVALVQNVPVFDISAIPEEFSQAAIPLLSSLTDVPSSEIQKRLALGRKFPRNAVKIKLDASAEQVARIESRRFDLPGVRIDVEVSRRYYFNEMASHVIGYLGRIRPDQVGTPGFENIPADAFIGQWGIEAKYDEVLRGTPGENVYEVNALGQKIRPIGIVSAVKGPDLHLTLDLDVQVAAEEAFGDRAGAAVAIDPNNGEVLAFVSRPAFDPNHFATGIKSDQWKALLNDPQKPLFNRALQSQYPPGSTFKIVVALAALENNRVSPSEAYFCKGGLQFGDRLFRCWKKEGHGSVDFYRGLVHSCDVYFYQTGLRIGIDPIARTAKAMGLGGKPELNLIPETAGVIPSTEWKKRKFNQPWYPGETLNAAIGQGYVLASPFQMAQMMATFASGGTLYQPRLVREEPVGTLGQMDIDPAVLRQVGEALRGVVEEGTARSARSQIVSIAGKTGTAQVATLEQWKAARGEERKALEDHAWFVAYAPVEKPAIALAVFVEHGGHGGSAAAPIAKAMIEAYVRKKETLAEATRTGL